MDGGDTAMRTRKTRTLWLRAKSKWEFLAEIITNWATK